MAAIGHLQSMMERRRVGFAVGLAAGLAIAALSACGTDNPESGDSTSSATDASTGSAQTTGTPPTGTSSTSANPTATDPSGTGDPATSTDPTATATESGTVGPTTGVTSSGGSSSTGTTELCGKKDARGPYFVFSHQGEDLLETDQPFILECGFQGAFMLEFGVVLGGVDPEGEYVDFALTMDVEGFNVGPSGHFYSEDINDLFVECEAGVGGVSALARIFIITPDEIADVTALDGAAVDFSITMTMDDATVVSFDSQGTVVAIPSKDWEFCGG